MLQSTRTLPGWILVTGFLMFFTVPFVQADDDLFSKFAIDTPFAETARPDSDDSGGSEIARGSRITGASSLATMLREADFKTQTVDTRVVATEIKQAKWSIPVRIRVIYDDDQMEIALLLKTLGDEYDEAAVSSEKLLELMAASRNYAPAYFAYDAEKKRIELRQRVSNRDVTSEKFNRQLERLAEIAIDNVAAWNLPKPAAATTATAQTHSPAPSPAQPASTALPAQSMLGTWAADRGKDEAIALKLDQDGKFILVIVKGSNNSRSNGSYVLNNTTIKLNGDDGTQLTGTVALQGTDGFNLQLPGAAKPIQFTKAN